MKRPERTRKIWFWNICTIALLILLLPIAGSSAVEQLATETNETFKNLARLIAKIPGSQTFSEMLPSGTVSGMPIRVVIVIIVLLALAAVLSKASRHRKMLTKEDEAREMRDL